MRPGHRCLPGSPPIRFLNSAVFLSFPLLTDDSSTGWLVAGVRPVVSISPSTACPLCSMLTRIGLQRMWPPMHLSIFCSVKCVRGRDLQVGTRLLSSELLLFAKNTNTTQTPRSHTASCLVVSSTSPSWWWWSPVQRDTRAPSKCISEGEFMHHHFGAQCIVFC